MHRPPEPSTADLTPERIQAMIIEARRLTAAARELRERTLKAKELRAERGRPVMKEVDGMTQPPSVDSAAAPPQKRRMT